MERLPDDILLLVFREVNTMELLRRVRGVCRRWRKLALHPDAWQHRSISTKSEQEDQKKLAWQVLKLAPRLRTLTTRIEDFGDNRDLEELVSTTACSVGTLNLSVTVDKVYEARETLKNQVAKGRLQNLDLTLPSDKTCLRFIIEEIKDCTLHTLKISHCNQTASLMCMPHHKDVWGEGSVNTLGYRGNATDTLLEFLLRVRSQSIQKVTISLIGVEFFSVAMLSLLGTLTTLRSCGLMPAVKELEALKLCTSLKHIALRFKESSNASPDVSELTAALCTYFRSPAAVQLYSVVLSSAEEWSDVLVLQGLSALAESGVCAVECLALRLPGSANAGRQLGAVLRGLPHLRSLYVFIGGNVSTRLLDAEAICPENVPPSLNDLVLCACPTSSFSLNMDALLGLSRLLEANGRLRVEITAFCSQSLCGHVALGPTYYGKSSVFGRSTTDRYVTFYKKQVPKLFC